MKTILKFTVCKNRNVRVPEYGTPGSAGIDFFIPENLQAEDLGFSPSLNANNNVFVFGANCVERIFIPPHVGVLIPSGIKTRIPPGHALIFVNKSGIAVKKGLSIGACLIDEDYTGEIHIHLYNTGNSNIELKAGDKIAQAVLLPVSHCELEKIETEEELYAGFESERSAGGFGSTGTSAAGNV